MNIDVFKPISIRGRVAYGICCLENALIALQYNLENWNIVLKHLWRYTASSNLEDCNRAALEVMPECILEFPEYDDDYEQISEDEYKILYELYQNLDESIDILLKRIYYVGVSDAYSSITNYSPGSLIQLQFIISCMREKDFPLPDPKEFMRFSILEDDGWGEEFDGTKLSKIL